MTRPELLWASNGVQVWSPDDDDDFKIVTEDRDASWIKSDEMDNLTMILLQYMIARRR